MRQASERGLQRRQQAWQRGRRGEALAVWLLRLKGYRILARDRRGPGGEIDIVARRGRTLAIIEVKSRGTLEAAAEAVSPRQRGRIERAALAFQAHRPELAGCTLRFDVVVLAGRWPRHLADAWRPGL